VVNGRLRCLGPAQHLKHRFGNGFEVNVKLQAPSSAMLQDLMQRAVGLMHQADVAAAADRRSRSLSNGHSAAAEPRRSGSLSGAAGGVLSGLRRLSAAKEQESPLEQESVNPVAAVSAAEPQQQTPDLVQVSLRSLDSIKIRRSQLPAVFEGLGNASRLEQVAPYLPGAQLHEAFELDGEGQQVPLRMLLEWWLWEDAADRLQQFMRAEFGGANGTAASLLERSTAQNFRYRVLLERADADDAVAPEDGTTGAGAGAVVAAGAVSKDSAQAAPIDAPPAPAPATASGAASPKMQRALSDIFAKFEAHKAALRILEYSVGQTTLEQIFNQFAAQQDNPEVQAASAAVEAAAAAAAAAAKAKVKVQAKP
jgi:hypothetical protein